jgi:hypothetical protein
MTAAVMLLLAAHAGQSARADITTALVPMYVYPAGTDLDKWTKLDESANKVNIDAIVNQQSGHVTFYDPNYAKAIAKLDATRYGKAFAYISTFTPSGIRSLSDMESDIEAYRNFYGGKSFAGFFIDQMSITTTTLSTYQQLYDYIKTIPGSSYSVIGNPGIPYIYYSSPTDYLTADQVLSTADQLVIFEGPNTAPDSTSAGFDRYPYGLDWFQHYPSSRFANIVYGTPDSTTMQNDFAKAQGLNAGSIYITDGTGGNPYDHLPSYWDQEVAMLPTPPTPEPSSLVVAAVCGIVGGAIAALRSRRRNRTQRNGG